MGLRTVLIIYFGERFLPSIISSSLSDDAPYVMTCLPALARTLIEYLASVDILHPSLINHTDAHTSAGYDPEASDNMNPQFDIAACIFYIDNPYESYLMGKGRYCYLVR